MKNRRQFLKQSLTGTLGLGALSMGSLNLADAFFNEAHAAITPASNDYKSLVVVNLNGGNDSLNMLIPNTQSEYNLYYAARSNIAFDKSDLLPISPTGMAAESFGLSPRMPGMQSLFESKDLSFVANVGSIVEPISKAEFLDPLNTKSLPDNIGAHNTQANYWQADHSNSVNTSKEGWGGNLADEFIIDGILPTNISVASGHTVFQSHQSQAFYNVATNGFVNLEDFTVGVTNPGILARRKAINALNQLAANADDPFLQHAGTLFQNGLDSNLSLQNVLTTVPNLSSEFDQVSVTNSGELFGSSLARIAELITVREQLNMRRQIFFVQLTGFDTHSSHAENHGNLSQDLSTFLKAFSDVMKDNGLNDSVLTVTMSEFGRNLVSNGDGTDHAWGAQHMVMGGPVDGGKIFGTFPSLELDGDDDYNGLGRMIPTTSISQYGSTIARWFGVPANRISTVFPNVSNFLTDDIGFLG